MSPSLCSLDTAPSVGSLRSVKSKASASFIQHLPPPQPIMIARRSSSLGCMKQIPSVSMVKPPSNAAPHPLKEMSRHAPLALKRSASAEGRAALRLMATTERVMKEQRQLQREFEKLMREKTIQKSTKEQEMVAAALRATFSL